MSKIKLKAHIIVTGKTTSASKEELVKTLQIGDTLEISTCITTVGRGPHSGLYATIVEIKNLTQPTVKLYFDSMTMVSKLLERIPHSVVEND
jgi:hypothetical protein